ncbi:hypothetical protein [Legionella tunisiensis]|uniref:hypothetical protein n=1 Tax=Legionella tunisiensis TaxID=1034944 RepID=UPI00031A43B1
MNASSDLDEKTLQEIANVTGGRYFRATDVQSLQNIYQIINKLETVTQEDATIRPQHDYYPWPLALAFFLLLYWLIKKIALWTSLKSVSLRQGRVS